MCGPEKSIAILLSLCAAVPPMGCKRGQQDSAPAAEIPSSSAAPARTAQSAEAEPSASVVAPAPIEAKGGRMIRIPSGKFMMGATHDGAGRPVHEVVMANFELDQTEVTVAAYREC